VDTPQSFEPVRGSSVLAVGFGITVAMWGVGYVGRLPAVQLPSPLILFLLLLCLLAGGVALGRHAGRGWRYGAIAGGLSGLLNLLILGGILAGEEPNSVVPSALLWLPGSVLVAALLAGVGASVGMRWPRKGPLYDNWSAALVKVAIGAALLLLAVGGLVTSAGAGLAVVDWPNTFGYNMFLYPFSRMTGGIYYEHAHRLFGALVGLTTLVLAVQIQLTDSRRWVRSLAWSIFALVVVQGLLGGLRVTGGFTFSTEAGAMKPSLALAMAHGVLGQLFLAALVALGVFTSNRWRDAPAPLSRSSAMTDRILGGVLVGFLLVQLVLGAVQRHFDAMLLVHVGFGVAVVAPLTLHVGFRSWGIHDATPLLRGLGLSLAVAVGVQVLLGVGAWFATDSLVLATVHQWFGAVLLALAVLLFFWNWRLVGRRESRS
jgi:cytochrome c oxidase assembly protein subunit 15